MSVETREIGRWQLFKFKLLWLYLTLMQGWRWHWRRWRNRCQVCGEKIGAPYVIRGLEGINVKPVRCRKCTKLAVHARNYSGGGDVTFPGNQAS